MLNSSFKVHQIYKENKWETAFPAFKLINYKLINPHFADE